MTVVQVTPPPAVEVSVVPAVEVSPGTGGGTTTVSFRQATPAAVWTVLHALGRVPQVEVTDDAGDRVLCDVDTDLASPFTVTIVHNTPQTGWVYLT